MRCSSFPIAVVILLTQYFVGLDELLEDVMRGDRLVLTIVLAYATASSAAQTPVQRMQQIVQPYVDAQMFMGAVLVARHGKVMFSQSYGMADIEWSIPNSSTTRFNLASMTKQFTAAAVLLLEDRGKLKTDDSIRKYFPEAPASWEKITIYNLLTHTSGISDDAATYVPGTPDRMIFHDKPLNFQPGEKWSYVNMGFLVLGYLIEKISGQSYEEFLKENIFQPLGMNDSGLESFVTILPHRASGYWPGANGLENAVRWDARFGFASGSLYSTTEDLLRWEEGLFSGKVLSPASFRKMITPFRNDYACGLFSKHVNGHLVIEHNGDNIGFNADMAYYPEEGLAIIVLANQNGQAMDKIATALAAVVHGEAVPPPSIHKEVPLSSAVLARYAGKYQFADGRSLEMAPEGNHLVTRSGMQFFPESETKFFSKAFDVQVEFLPDDKGEFKVLIRRDHGKDDKATKM